MTVDSLFFSRSRSLALFSLFAVIFGLIGLIITLVWPSFGKTAVIFIDHVFIKSAIYIYALLDPMKPVKQHSAHKKVSNVSYAPYCTYKRNRSLLYRL